MAKFADLFLVLIAAVLLSSCRITAINVEGGSLYIAKNGDRVPISLCLADQTCLAGNICMAEMTDAKYYYQFKAVEEEGWIFDHWQAGNGFLCGDSKVPQCNVSLVKLDDETAEKIIASSQTLYVMPVFRHPRDIIEVDGKEWYQPYLYTNLSWYDINSICPDGICNGELNGYNLTGWSWASVNDLNELGNHYFGSEVLGPGPDSAIIYSRASESLTYFLSDGWAPNAGGSGGTGSYCEYARQVTGWTKDGLDSDSDSAWRAFLSDTEAGLGLHVRTDTYHPKPTQSNSVGAWFYRIP